MPEGKKKSMQIMLDKGELKFTFVGNYGTFKQETSFAIHLEEESVDK